MKSAIDNHIKNLNKMMVEFDYNKNDISTTIDFLATMIDYYNYARDVKERAKKGEK